MKRSILSLAAGLVALTGATQANAAATLTITDGTTTTNVVVDEISPDANPGVGAVGVTPIVTVGGFSIYSASGLTKPVFGSALQPAMELGLIVAASGPGTLTVWFSDIGFGPTGPATGVLDAQLTGLQTGGASTVQLKVYGDSGNVLNAQTSSLADSGALSWPPPFTGYPVSGSLALSGPFSLTEVVVINAASAGIINVDAHFNITLDHQGGVAGCRVTGGSNHETNNFQGPCITTEVPTFVSHGGQVGASHSLGTPWSPNSPCISGELEHNRHLTKNGLVGALHASGNGKEHDFDSLICACLPCPENPGTVGSVGALCNPGDRICGPEPSHAPANKICYSGVGDFTFGSGPKTVQAVFRVDIEDRSEGNSQSSTPPPDRYRIRIWVLDPSCGRDADPSSAANMFLRFAASADPLKIGVLATTEELKVTVGVPAPDIDDGGNMTQGNHQIHPQTGSPCP